MGSTFPEGSTPHESNGETSPLNGNMRRFSHEPSHEFRRSELQSSKSVYSVVAVRQPRPKRRPNEQFDLRSSVNLALGPLSDLISQLRLLERKRDILRHLMGRKVQPQPSNNLISPESGRIKSLEIERDELSKNLAHWQTQYNQLTAYSNTLVDNLQKLQSSLGIQSENELVEQFELLCFNIKTCAEEFQRKNPHGRSILSKSNSENLLNLIGLDPEFDRDFLQYDTGRKHLSRAYICRVLVKRVLYSENDDGSQVKDLWTSESIAIDLAAMENRMKEIDLLPGEFNKWRSITVRHLAQKPLEGNPRMELLVDDLFQMLLAIFGMTSDFPGADKLRANLKSYVVSKAVTLSQSLRKQLSNISISNHGSSNRDVPLTSISSLSISDKREDCSEAEEGVDLMVFPAMVRSTDEHGAMAPKQLVLVHSKHIWLGRVMSNKRASS